MPSLDQQLETAIENHDLSSSQSLIDQGANVNHFRNTSGYDFYILYNVVNNTKHSAKEVEFLLANDVDPNTKNSPQLLTALHSACEFSNLDVIKLLLSNSKTNIEARDNNGLTPLLHCKTLDAAKLLIEAGADVNTIDNDGRPAIYRLAVLAKNRDKNGKNISHELVDLILDNGANPNLKTIHGSTPFHGCVDPRMVNSLLNHGGDPDVVNDYGHKPISIKSNYDNIPVDPQVYSLINQHIAKILTSSIEDDDIDGEHIRKRL